MKKHYFLPALIMALFSGGLMAETLLTVNGNKIDSREIDRQIKLIRQDNPQIPNCETNFSATRLPACWSIRKHAV